MKRILETIFIFATLSFVTLFFDITHVNALTPVQIRPKYLYYRFNNSDTYQNFNYSNLDYLKLDYLNDKKISNLYPNFTGYRIPVYVKANELTDYYLTTNSYRFSYENFFNQGILSNDNNFYTLYFRMYASAKNNEIQAGIFESYQIFNRLHFSVQSRFGDANNETYKPYDCLTTSSNSDFPSAVISCRVPKKYIEFFSLFVDLDNKAYAQTDSATDYIENIYYLYLSSDINYESDNLGLLNVTSSVSGSDITLNFNATDEDNVVGYYYTLGSYDYVYTTEKSVTLTGFSNGSYSGTAKAVYKDGSNTPLSTFNVDVKTSLLPVLRYIVSYNDSNIYVDLRDSYAMSGKIEKYYLKLDDGSWIDIPTNHYTFSNVNFGKHTLYFRIVDSNGNVAKATYNFTSKSSNEVVADTISNFFDSFKKSTEDFWSNFRNMLRSLFVPSKEDLSNWFKGVNESLTNQFGFLSYPFTWIITFLERFTELTDTGSYMISWPDFKVANFDGTIISAGSFDLASLLNDSNIKNMHDIYLMCVDALLMLSFFNYCSNIYNRVFGNNDTYETDILSASQNYTIDDNNQVHQSVTAHKTHREYRNRKKV